MDKSRQYIAIDLKSFYASSECVERGLDPLTTNLVVADTSRTEKTICLAVSPSLKQYGIPGRARLFEVIQKVKEINRERLKKAPNHKFTGKSFNDLELKRNPSLELDFIAATPQMAHYIKKSTEIYKTYLKYIDAEDIHVYSIDEMFADVTKYMKTYKKNAEEIATMMILDVYKQTGITATGGIGDNLYLAKVAMDIIAKHTKENKDGVRIGHLTEQSYRELLWDHTPLTDFWRVGRGLTKRLFKLGLVTMGDIARQSLIDEDVLYQEFGINAELLIDHAWGYEPVTIKDIKDYKPKNNSLSVGQVLSCPYEYEKARLIVKEMADSLALDLTSKGLLTDQIVLSFGYDIGDLTDSMSGDEVETDWYGRKVPTGEHGSINLPHFTSSGKEIVAASTKLFERLINKKLHVRRVYIGCPVIKEDEANNYAPKYEQLSLFMNVEDSSKEIENKKDLEQEKELQKTILKIKKKYGKNSVLKAMDYEEGGTTIERNKQIGGHKA
ncbi:MAG: DNA methylase [Bacilli bacterium]|nr:DNA methylase [Bacilli bacterium]